MHEGKMVFSQFLELISRKSFQACVDRHRGDWKVKSFYFLVLGVKLSPSGDFMFTIRCMEHYRRTSHTRFDIKLHFVWITKYRKPFLTGTIATRVRDLVRQVCTEFDVEILKW